MKELIKSQTPAVSIVVVNHNGYEYLKRVIPALKNLSYKRLEIIIVDNGSSDGSEALVNQYDEVQFIRSPRFREKNFACNFAVKHANGEYLLLLDNDLIIQDSNIIQKLVHRYEARPDTGVLGFALRNEGEEFVSAYGIYLGLFFDKSLKKINELQAREINGCLIGYAPGPCIFIKKDRWDRAGGYDEHLAFGGDDNDLGIKMWLLGYRNYLYSDSIQIHIGMAERTDLLKWSYKFRKMTHAHFYTIYKNYTLKNVFLYLPLYVVFSLLKGIKQSLKRRSFKPALAWFGGVLDFLCDYKALDVGRRRVQSMRSEKNDIYLHVNPPNVYDK